MRPLLTWPDPAHLPSPEADPARLPFPEVDPVCLRPTALVPRLACPPSQEAVRAGLRSAAALSGPPLSRRTVRRVARPAHPRMVRRRDPVVRVVTHPRPPAWPVGLHWQPVSAARRHARDAPRQAPTAAVAAPGFASAAVPGSFPAPAAFAHRGSAAAAARLLRRPSVARRLRAAAPAPPAQHRQAPGVPERFAQATALAHAESPWQAARPRLAARSAIVRTPPAAPRSARSAPAC